MTDRDGEGGSMGESYCGVLCGDRKRASSLCRGELRRLEMLAGKTNLHLTIITKDEFLKTLITLQLYPGRCDITGREELIRMLTK